MPELLHTLKTTFGYDAFRPLQREIIETSLAGRDVFALLPTGRGTDARACTKHDDRLPGERNRYMHT